MEAGIDHCGGGDGAMVLEIAMNCSMRTTNSGGGDGGGQPDGA